MGEPGAARGRVLRSTSCAAFPDNSIILIRTYSLAVIKNNGSRSEERNPLSPAKAQQALSAVHAEKRNAILQKPGI